MKPILEIQHISKKFKINNEQLPYLSIRDSLSNVFKKKTNTTDFLALNDVNFTVDSGESFAIIGKNGAGKSTLLKILSKITPPTSGKIIGRGRIASLLEVGTGFHPELTGRENVFMNGSILGMRRSEILKNFDAIVDFSGIEKFIDTPLKHYSSGMQLRLAFAVAAFLENEILVVDEVLAVGDAEFQKKCIGKMNEISHVQGRTLLFVSHNMAAVKSLCDKALVLEKGTVKLIDTIDNAVNYYLKGSAETLNYKKFDAEYDKEEFCLNSFKFKNKDKSTDEALIENQEIEFETNFTIKGNDGSDYHITYHLYNELGEAMFSFSHSQYISLSKGANNIVCSFPPGFFNSGTYYLSFYLIKNKATAIFIERDIMHFTIVDSERPLGAWMGKEPGYIKPTFAWHKK